MIIDSHTHLGKNDATPERLLESMKRSGTDYALIIAGESFSKTLPSTEELIEMVKPHKNLFAIAAASPFNISATRLNELESYIKSGKVKGIKLFPGYEHYYAPDERLTGVYELSLRFNIPIIFHTGLLWDPEKKGLIKYSNPLAIDEVATKFPDLKIVIAHMGNPWAEDCAAVVYKNKNIYVDISGFFTDFGGPFPKEEKNSFLAYIEKIGGIVDNLKQRMLYGTDWPLCDMKEYVKIASAIKLTPEERELLFWKNAANLFNLSV